MAQQTSGSISGTVLDTQGAAVEGAKVALFDTQQGSIRQVITSKEGSFVFTPVQPSEYNVTVEAKGFSKLEQKGIRLFANDKLELEDFRLTVGSVSETVTVQATSVVLQTESAERGGVITGEQVVNLALNGRNYTGLLKTVPGINADTNNVNGRRTDQNNLAMDGVTTLDTGNNGFNLISLNTDAIAEFKVLTNSQQAEFGRAAGASINIVTRGGTREFHGVGYIFHRHESLNANTFTNNYNGLQRPLYRFNTPGFTIGGPVVVPKFNRTRDKLFFFVAADFTKQLALGAQQNITVPTAAERRAIFPYHNADGSSVIIRDPLTGAAFPNNQIPLSRINPDGQKILNFFPLPNLAGQPNYNYQSQVPGQDNPTQYISRVDYNISEKWRLSARGIINRRPRVNVYGDQNSGNNIGLGKGFDVTQLGSTYALNLTTIISPTLTNEFITGRSWNQIVAIPLDDTYSNARVGLQFKTLYPTADALQFIPNFTWGNVPNAPSTSFRGLPYHNENPTIDITDNVAKVQGAHTLKAGFFLSRSRKQQVASNPVNGILGFDADSQNPGDSNWGFSNALLGNYRSFQQSNSWPDAHYQFYNAEWYVQDNWKISRTFALDYGIRFAVIAPQYETDNLISTFSPALYDPKKAVSLYESALDANRRAVARNPLTGELVPRVLLGAIVPGSGDVDNGIALAGTKGVPQGLIPNRGVHYGPRLGLAWNPWSGKTVIRAGGGIFYDRLAGNETTRELGNPPTTRTPQIFYGNIDNLASASGTLFPVDVNGLSGDGHVPTTYNWNVTVQRTLPFQVVLDVAYVGSSSNHLAYLTSYNDADFGSAYLPQNQDPTVTPRFDGTTTLPLNFTRPYVGIGTARNTSFGANSNYHALQISGNRRLSKGLEFGFTYTWSKTMGTADANGTVLSPLLGRNAYYGLLPFDRTQNVQVNYIYYLPKLAGTGFLNNPVGRILLNGWIFSGITTLASGAPDSLSYSISGISGQALNRTLTGSESFGPRPVLTGNPNRTQGNDLFAYIDTSVVRPAVKGSRGNDSALRQVRRPGLNNSDLSVFKNIAYTQNEQRFVQLRFEFFNAFNHTQWSDFNRSATFNAAGTLTNLPTALGGGGGRFGFGTQNAVRSARIIQLAAKFYF